MVVESNEPNMLRGLAEMNAEVVEALLGAQLENLEASKLGPREYAMVKIAGLVGIDASPTSYAWQVGFAKNSGVTDADILGILVALSPTLGYARIVAAAGDLALALGFLSEGSEDRE